jgi:hypothetical protein
MGGGTVTTEDLNARQAYRQRTGTGFAHTQTMASTPVAQRHVHERLDPKWLNQEGEQIRESRDSTEHPDSKAVAVLFDETASMGDGPIILQQKLGTTYGAITRGGYLADPQILIGAIGDGQNGEIAPLQLGQFESDGRFEEDLNSIYLELNGGGNGGESYGLALYFLANYSRIDCLDLRGEKGYLFITGDERPHPVVTRQEIKDYLGVDVEADVSIEDVVAQVQEKYEVFLLHVNTSSAQTQRSRERWTELLGEEFVVPLESLETISETIALLIGLREGKITSVAEGAEHLTAEGADPNAVASASKAVAVVTKDHGGGEVAVASGTGNLPATTDDGDEGGGSHRL